MRLFFASALVLLCANIYAQDTAYYDETETVVNKSLASHYKIVEHKGSSDIVTVRSYFMSGKIKSEVNYSSYSRQIQDGKETEWNEDGQKISETNYKEGKFEGEKLTFWSNGQIKRKEVYKEGVSQGGAVEYTSVGKEYLFTIVEQMPEFPGGDNALFKFLSDNVKYPRKARNKGITGKVYIHFVVDKEGNVTDISLLRGVSPEIDEEALRVMRLMPKWKPGYQNGRAVSVMYNLPINFTLRK